MVDKNKESYECSICLENIKLNEDINILKCGHLFHYKCIERLVDHHLNCCPNCRCDLKTGKNESNNQNNNNSLFSTAFFNIYGNIFPNYDDYEFGHFFEPIDGVDV